MPAPTLIELTDEQRNEYQCLCRSGKTEVRLKLRLSIVLLADEGLTNTEIAESLSISAPTVSRWRNRFSTDGLGKRVRHSINICVTRLARVRVKTSSVEAIQSQ